MGGVQLSHHLSLSSGRISASMAQFDHIIYFLVLAVTMDSLICLVKKINYKRAQRIQVEGGNLTW